MHSDWKAIQTARSFRQSVLTMKKRIIFIINPISGTQHSDDIEAFVRKELSADVFDITFRYTERQGHGGEIAAEAVRDGMDIVAVKGRFGPYLRYGDKNVKRPRNADPLTISLEECLSLISEAETKAPAAANLAEFGDIKVVNGRYGPYIKKGDSNYKIPKGMDAASLTESDCQAIINHSEPTTKFKKRAKK